MNDPSPLVQALRTLQMHAREIAPEYASVHGEPLPAAWKLAQLLGSIEYARILVRAALERAAAAEIARVETAT